MAHTPGPWTVVTRTRKQSSGKPEVVYEIFQDKGAEVGWRVAEIVFPHDAPLISAAPDLWRALQDCLTVITTGKRFMSGDERERAMHAENSAVSAIRKATGDA
jgi:hypothetical protein